MKKLALTIMFLLICGPTSATNLKKGVWIDLTPCEVFGNTDPICTGVPLVTITKKDTNKIVEKPIKITKTVNKSIRIPTVRYIGQGKYCYPLPKGDGYEWKCDTNE